MTVSYWRGIVALCCLGLLVMPAVSWSQGSLDPKIIEGAKKEGQLVDYTTVAQVQSACSSPIRD